MNKPMMANVVFWVQTFILFMLYIAIMSNDWCRFYLYRGHA